MESKGWWRWAGLSGVLGSTLFITGMISVALSDTTTWDLSETLGLFGFTLSVPLLALGFFALSRYHARAIGPLGQAGFVVTIIGLTVTLIALSGRVVGLLTSREIDGMWSLMVSGVFVTLVGMILFGASGLRLGGRTKVGSMALLLGSLAGLLGLMGASWAYGKLSTEIVNLLMWLSLAMLCLSSAGCALMGYSLWAVAKESDPSTAIGASRA